MRAYAMDLRVRAVRLLDAGLLPSAVAAQLQVSGSWVRLLRQRRRETGAIGPRAKRYGLRRKLEPHLHTLAALIPEQPDRTLAEPQDALPVAVSLPTIWRAVEDLRLRVKKNGPADRTRSP